MSKVCVWSHEPNAFGMRTQLNAFHPTQYRHQLDMNFNPDKHTDAADFIEKYPGDLYYCGDEPEAQQLTPRAYALIYEKFVKNVQSISRKAKVSPGKFIGAPSGIDCGYIGQFAGFNRAQIDEWRFGANYNISKENNPDELTGWGNHLEAASVWAVEHHAPMVIGGFTHSGNYHPDPKEDPTDINVLQSVVDRVFQIIHSISNIVDACYWHLYHPHDEIPEPHVFNKNLAYGYRDPLLGPRATSLTKLGICYLRAMNKFYGGCKWSAVKPEIIMLTSLDEVSFNTIREGDGINEGTLSWHFLQKGTTRVFWPRGNSPYERISINRGNALLLERFLTVNDLVIIQDNILTITNQAK